MPNNISDAALDAYYSRGYYGPGTDYFDPPGDDWDPDEDPFDPDWDGWIKKSERE